MYNGGSKFLNVRRLGLALFVYRNLHVCTNAAKTECGCVRAGNLKPSQNQRTPSSAKGDCYSKKECMLEKKLRMSFFTTRCFILSGQCHVYRNLHVCTNAAKTECGCVRAGNLKPSQNQRTPSSRLFPGHYVGPG